MKTFTKVYIPAKDIENMAKNKMPAQYRNRELTIVGVEQNKIDRSIEITLLVSGLGQDEVGTNTKRCKLDINELHNDKEEKALDGTNSKGVECRRNYFNLFYNMNDSQKIDYLISEFIESKVNEISK